MTATGTLPILLISDMGTSLASLDTTRAFCEEGYLYLFNRDFQAIPMETRESALSFCNQKNENGMGRYALTDKSTVKFFQFHSLLGKQELPQSMAVAALFYFSTIYAFFIA